MIAKTLQELTTLNIPLEVSQPICEEISIVGYRCNCKRLFSSNPADFNVIAVYNEVDAPNLMLAIVRYTCPHCKQEYLIFASFNQFYLPNPLIALHETSILVEVETLNYLYSMQKQFEPPSNQNCTTTQYLHTLYNNLYLYITYKVALDRGTERDIRKAVNKLKTPTNHIPFYFTKTDNIPKKYYQVLDLIGYIVYLIYSSATSNFFIHSFLRKSEKFAEYYTPISLDKLSI